MFTPLTFGIALLAAVIIPRIIGGTPVRVLAFVSLGAATVYTGFVPLWGGVLIALAPLITFLLLIVYAYWLGQRALSGKMGEETQWIAELVKDDNKPFIEAMNHLNQSEMKEITIIADNKEELKELALERAKENLD